MRLPLVLGAVITKSSSPELKGGPLSIPSQEAEDKLVIESNGGKEHSTVSITVVGASGDLAKKKIFPALFALYYEGCLPEVYKETSFRSDDSLYCLNVVSADHLIFLLSLQHFTIYGYARSKMTDAELRDMVSKTLTCRIDKR